MAKISRNSLKQDVQRNYGEEDHINRLPDDLIINILTRMPVKESCKSGLVSRRFDKLWILSIYPNLNFEFDYLPLWKLYFSKLIDEQSSSWPEFAPIVEKKRHLFVGLLEKVLKSYQQPDVDEIVVNFYFNSSFSSVIDDLLKFSFSKGVKRLHLDFAPRAVFLQWETPYAFPSLDKLSTYNNNHHNVRDVCLKHVSIDQDAVDCLLSTCPLLERLHLLPEKLLTLKITGETLKLKHLEMEWCFDAECIEISAPNLISFYYCGNESALRISNVPLLSEFCARLMHLNHFLQGFDPHFGFLFQLKIFKLHMSDRMIKESISYPLAWPESLNLEQLEVTIDGFDDGGCQLWPIVLIKASPLLQKFVVKFWTFTRLRKEEPPPEILWRRIREATKFSHKFLKVLEISDFKGSSSEIEFAQHLLNIDAPSLEKLVIRTCTRGYFDKFEQDQAKDVAQSVCKGLDSIVHIDIL